MKMITERTKCWNDEHGRSDKPCELFLPSYQLHVVRNELDKPKSGQLVGLQQGEAWSFYTLFVSTQSNLCDFVKMRHRWP